MRTKTIGLTSVSVIDEVVDRVNGGCRMGLLCVFHRGNFIEVLSLLEWLGKIDDLPISAGYVYEWQNYAGT